MRYYLDTNFLYFLLFEKDRIHNDIYALTDEPTCLLYVSSVVVKELIHLYKATKISHFRFKSAKDIITAIDQAGIEIKPLNRYHLLQYAALETTKGHKDPNDHIIISQAISDKIPIISSDRKFKEYIGQGLGFVFNKQ